MSRKAITGTITAVSLIIAIKLIWDRWYSPGIVDPAIARRPPHQQRRRRRRPCLFPTLPGDLRDQIYHYALSGTLISINPASYRGDETPLTASYYDNDSDRLQRLTRIPQWLQTNRQIRNEGLEQWYKEAKFSLAATWTSPRDLPALQDSSALFRIDRIKNLTVVDMTAVIEPLADPEARIGHHNPQQGFRPGIEPNLSVLQTLANFAAQGFNNLEKANIVIEWIPGQIISSQRQDIDRVFQPIFPPQLQCLEVVFISRNLSPHLQNTGTTLLSPNHFQMVQQSLTMQCRTLALAVVVNPVQVQNNVPPTQRHLRGDFWRDVRIYQYFQATIQTNDHGVAPEE